MGAGRTELALSIFGNTKNYKILSGNIYINGEEKHFKTPKHAIQAGMAYVTEDRKGNGLILISLFLTAVCQKKLTYVKIMTYFSRILIYYIK